jgi:hypothetical protein
MEVIVAAICWEDGERILGVDPLILFEATLEAWRMVGSGEE